MTVPFRTFALFGLALGMLAAGYLFAPAPGASKSLPTQPLAKVVPPAPPKPTTTLVANRPPVPLVTQPRIASFQTVERITASPASDKPTVDMGTFSSNPPSANPPDQKDITQALAAPTAVDDSPAKRAIEFDGYRNVRDLTKGPDGTWRGRAMRGRTEIAVRVDATGSVSAE
jgi:hypothetical protein